MAAAPLSGGGAAARFAVRDLRAYLRGRWRCERSLADRGVAARFDGVARFSDGAAGTGTTRLDYKEEGVVTMEGGGSSSATRAYTYTFPDGPAVAEVLFEDGRFFHPLDLQSGEWQATHLCGDDVYEGAFAALSEDTWTMTWNVKGPRKDQTLRTRFLRESE